MKVENITKEEAAKIVKYLFKIFDKIKRGIDRISL
jgi:hypothetical protein